MESRSTGTLRPTQLGLLLGLFFLSGAAALVYEVLWLKELGRLFGVTAHAAATTLAVFFLGLAAGGLVWGPRSARVANPLRVYGWLELAIGASGLLYFLVLSVYRSVYGPLFNAFGDRPTLFLAVKLALAVGILFPPAFFMGGTLPVMGQYLVRSRDQLGLKASLLYALNTFGAATGAFLAGFYLPPTLGFRNSYLVAILINVTIGLLALAWSRSANWVPPAPPDSESARPEAGPVAVQPLRPSVVWAVAAVSGFATLGLEVLWVRMFAQVLQNSVYTFSAILTVFLLSLALGSGLANLLCRTRLQPVVVLFWLTALSGLLAGLTPLVFYELTSGLELIDTGIGWYRYLMVVFGEILIVLLIPVAVMGSVFPYLMKLSEGWSKSAGGTIGRLAAINTAAAIFGSLAAGFLMLDVLGLWASIRFMAAAYLALAAVVVMLAPVALRPLVSIPVAGAVLLGGVLTYSDFDVVHVDRENGEELLQVWEGSHGTVAVVRRGDVLKTKVNNSYTLAASDAAVLLRRQAWIPLSLHRAPSSVFFLGMGTGISAGGALDFPVERVVVTELSDDIVKASRFPKGKGDDPGESSPERFEAMEYVARVLAQIPEPRKHQVRYYGYYSCAARGKRLKEPAQPRAISDAAHESPPEPPPGAAALRKRWADLLRRVYEIDPLVCARCAGTMRVISFITQPAVIRRILAHLARTPRPAPRPPPPEPRPLVATP